MTQTRATPTWTPNQAATAFLEAVLFAVLALRARNIAGLTHNRHFTWTIFIHGANSNSDPPRKIELERSKP